MLPLKRKEIDSLEAKVGQVIEKLDDLICGVSVPSHPDVADDFNSIINEQEEGRRIVRNLLIYGLKESTHAVPTERKKADSDILKSDLLPVLPSTKALRNVFRAGKVGYTTRQHLQPETTHEKFQR